MLLPNSTPRELRLVLCGLLLALTLAALDQNIVATALPTITSELGGLQHLSWVVTSFIVASTVSAPLYGKLSDLYGRKPAFIASILIFLIGSGLCGVAGSIGELIAFRALQGLGAGGLIVLAQTVIGDLVSPRERGRYQGLFAAVFTACSVAGPLLGGFITEYASWRWIFYVNLPVGFAALLFIAIGLRPRPRGPEPQLDLLGAVLLITGTCSLLLVLSWGGNAYAWCSAPLLGLGAVALAAFVLLAVVERRTSQPILPPDLFRNPVFLLGAAVIALTAMALFAAVVFLPLMFQLLMGASPARAGLMIAPMMGGVIVASFAGGRLVSRTGRYKPLPTVGLLATHAVLRGAGLGSAIRPWRPADRGVARGDGSRDGAGDAEPDHGDPERSRPRPARRRHRIGSLFPLARRRRWRCAVRSGACCASAWADRWRTGHSRRRAADCRLTRDAACARARGLPCRPVWRVHRWHCDRGARFPDRFVPAGTPAAQYSRLTSLGDRQALGCSCQAAARRSAISWSWAGVSPLIPTPPTTPPSLSFTTLPPGRPVSSGSQK